MLASEDSLRVNNSSALYLGPWKLAKNRTVTVAPHFGFVIPHNPQMKHLIKGHSFGAQATWMVQMMGDKPWHQRYNYPEMGYDVFFSNTGNLPQLGYQFGASYLMNLSLLRLKKHVNSFDGFNNWIGLGIGFGYSTKTWDLEENHQADVIGSHFNACLTLQYSARFLTIGKYDLRTGIRITHFSNGAFQLPNQGTNNLGCFIALSHRQFHNTPLKGNIEEFSKTWNTSNSLVIGFKEISPPMGKKYPSVTFQTLQERHFTYKSSLGVGLDLMYNSSLKSLLERYSEESISSKDVFQIGGVLSYAMHFDRFKLIMQQGFYLKSKWKSDGSLYHRVGLRYAVNENLGIQLALKTHFAKADHGEIGLIYQWK
jgi:hypothetical protein